MDRMMSTLPTWCWRRGPRGGQAATASPPWRASSPHQPRCKGWVAGCGWLGGGRVYVIVLWTIQKKNLMGFMIEINHRILTFQEVWKPQCAWQKLKPGARCDRELPWVALTFLCCSQSLQNMFMRSKTLNLQAMPSASDLSSMRWMDDLMIVRLWLAARLASLLLALAQGWLAGWPSLSQLLLPPPLLHPPPETFHDFYWMGIFWFDGIFSTHLVTEEAVLYHVLNYIYFFFN